MMENLYGDSYKTRFDSIDNFISFYCCQVVGERICNGLRCEMCKNRLREIIEAKGFKNIVFSVKMYEATSIGLPVCQYMEANNIPYLVAPMNTEGM